MRRLLLPLWVPLLSSLALACASSPASEAKDDAPAPAPAPAQGPEAEGQPPAGDPAAAADDVCAPASYTDWEGCNGKRTRVVGKRPEFVQQHPMMSQPEGLNPDNRNTHQGYMEIAEGSQVIVLTSAPFDCAAGMTVVGVLDRIDLGGEPGTKDSYAGWMLTDAEVSCD